MCPPPLFPQKENLLLHARVADLEAMLAGSSTSSSASSLRYATLQQFVQQQQPHPHPARMSMPGEVLNRNSGGSVQQAGGGPEASWFRVSGGVAGWRMRWVAVRARRRLVGLVPGLRGPWRAPPLRTCTTLGPPHVHARTPRR